MPNELPPEGWAPDLWTGEGVDDLDLEQQRLWQREMFDQMFAMVQVKKLDRVKTDLDTLRGEPKKVWSHGRRRPADKARRFQAPVQCRAYVDHQPRQTILLRYGIDSPRDVVFTFLDFVLDELGVNIGVGDVVTFENEDFELTEVRKPTESYWINTEFKFYVIGAAQRYRTEGNRRVDYGGR